MREDIEIGWDQVQSWLTVEDEPDASERKQGDHALECGLRYLRDTTLAQLVIFSDPGTVGAAIAVQFMSGFEMKNKQARSLRYDDDSVPELHQVLECVLLRAWGANHRLAFLLREVDSLEESEFLAKALIVAVHLVMRRYE